MDESRNIQVVQEVVDQHGTHLIEMVTAVWTDLRATLISIAAAAYASGKVDGMTEGYSRGYTKARDTFEFAEIPPLDGFIPRYGTDAPPLHIQIKEFIDGRR